MHVHSRIPFKKKRSQEEEKEEEKEEDKEGEKKGEKEKDGPYLRPKRRTPLRFDQIHEGPQDPFCANARGNVEEDHRTMKKRRERAGNVRATERGRVRFRTDDRNVF